MSGWIGVDLDGTLAHYDGWRGPEHIGSPVAPMVERVKLWLYEGREVRVMTARVYADPNDAARLAQVEVVRDAIAAWCFDVFGCTLPVTCTKDYGMIVLYDDRCIQVEENTGRLIGSPA